MTEPAVNTLEEPPGVMAVDYATDPVWGCALAGKGWVLKTHPASKCKGQTFCVVHNPSDHHMRGWETTWRADKGVLERHCSHGCGHPDPDDLAYHESQGRGALGVHGCDGCCEPVE